MEWFVGKNQIGSVLDELALEEIESKVEKLKSDVVYRPSRVDYLHLIPRVV